MHIRHKKSQIPLLVLATSSCYSMELVYALSAHQTAFMPLLATPRPGGAGFVLYVRVGVNLVQFSGEEHVRPAESEHRDLGVG